jgi:4,5-dihydroxyphthalate decarboxylase
MSGKLSLTVASCPYDHVRDLLTGDVACENLDITAFTLGVEEIFHRFMSYREWDVAEVSLGQFTALKAAGDDSLIGIPVFPCRMFRHTSIFVRANSGITEPSQLRGRRIGVPEWAQTATVYARGLLQHEYGVPLSSVRWFQGGTNDAGRREKVPLDLGDEFDCTVVTDRSLSDMLADGELDAVLSARPPRCFTNGDGSIVRLIKNTEAAEREYWARTGIFPIMHAIAIRREIVEEHPWVPATLYKGFAEALRRSVARAASMQQSYFPVPWIAYHATASWAGFGEHEPWAYGVEPNRATLEAFLGFAAEQRVLRRALTADELFHPAIADPYRV